LLAIVSTHGEGDPPDKAVQFHEFLHGNRAPKLGGVQFSVLALGDLTYEHFCQTGKDFDKRLEELGAARLFPRTDCDVAYDEPADAWMEGVLAALCREAEDSGQAVPAANVVAQVADSAQPAAAEYCRARPFSAEVLENLTLNGRGSDKETRHLEVSLEGSGFQFEPGDALGVYPENDPRLVDALLEQMRWKPDELVPVGKEQHPLREALLNDYEITVLTKPLVKQAAQFSRDGLAELLRPEHESRLTSYLGGRDLLNLVRDFSLSGTPAEDFVGILRKMPPRLYSIANSYEANPDEVHLTVAVVRYHAHGRGRAGVCSIQCAERVQPGDRLRVYVNSNPNFRLPTSPDAPMIMVGPGTGVAPFRGFLEQREETGATGKNWLFFGSRRFRTDFLYQVEWQRWLSDGVLTRMDVAFSRDTKQKVYVQHRMLEHSRELFSWLEEGAYFYVCGDEQRMAPDVHATLETIVRQEGGLSADAARDYVTELQQQGRYQRDVY
jgi:sulfite reductase (NADPH) flavoprotein alpha-component